LTHYIFHLSIDLLNTGKLFEKVVIDLKCDAKDILHIGDNKKSDIKIPRRYGFKTAYYPSYNGQFKIISSSNKSLLRLFNSYRSDFIQSYLLKQNINAKSVDVSKKADCFFGNLSDFITGH
jgi:predicted HAD superfamily hydrolase